MTSKTKRVTYYCCDYCKKRGGRVDAMKHHEERCTMNANRKCGMCSTPRQYKNLASEFSVECIARSEDRMEALHWLDAKVHCPACMLTVMRLSSVAAQFADIFKFKEAMDKWNDEIANEDPRFA